MQLIQVIVFHVLVIALSSASEGISEGCNEWDAKGDSEVCCNQCKPGNHLVEKCGTDPSKLCTPCEPMTYSHSLSAWYCKRCTQCIDPQVVVKPCDRIKDTVCGCKPGFRCGNLPQCDYCVTECAVGQEPTAERICRKCPEGTFNDKIHSTCKPWSKSCPEGEQMIGRGNDVSDIKCSRIPAPALPETTFSTPKEIITLKTTERAKTKDHSVYTLIGFFGVISVCTIIIILLLFLAFKKKRKIKIESKDPKPDIRTQGELTIMMVDHEEPCSFHRPEQEQGGSSESIDTQDSETKLIV